MTDHHESKRDGWACVVAGEVLNDVITNRGHRMIHDDLAVALTESLIAAVEKYESSFPLRVTSAEAGGGE